MSTLRRLVLSLIAALAATCLLPAHHAWPVDRTGQITGVYVRAEAERVVEGIGPALTRRRPGPPEGGPYVC